MSAAEEIFKQAGRDLLNVFGATDDNGEVTATFYPIIGDPVTGIQVNRR